MRTDARGEALDPGAGGITKVRGEGDGGVGAGRRRGGRGGGGETRMIFQVVGTVHANT